jgi:hypothetical protein
MLQTDIKDLVMPSTNAIYIMKQLELITILIISLLSWGYILIVDWKLAIAFFFILMLNNIGRN